MKERRVRTGLDTPPRLAARRLLDQRFGSYCVDRVAANEVSGVSSYGAGFAGDAEMRRFAVVESGGRAILVGVSRCEPVDL